MKFFWIILLILFYYTLIACANIEKEIFSYTVDKVSTSSLEELLSWSKENKLVTLKPPYTIQRYDSIVPFKNYEEFNNDLNGEKEKWYVLDELKKDYIYEARVSYAATSPTDFILDIISLEDVARIIKARKGRKGLNYSKLNSDQITITNKRFLRVRAIYTGVSNVPRRESKPVIYNIVMETLTFGVPRVAFKLILVLGIAAGVSHYIFIPKIYESLRKLLEKTDEKIKDT